MTQENDVAAAWDRNAEAWADITRNRRDRMRELFTDPTFLRFVPDLAGKEVIDLGCAEGASTRLFAARGARMTGVDLSSVMIASARAEEVAHPLGIDYRLGSFATLADFPDRRFDRAVSMMAFMDGPGFAAAMTAVNRVLRPGGRLDFCVLHPAFVRKGANWVTGGPNRHYLGVLISDYWSEEPYSETLMMRDRDGATVTMPRFQMTMARYFNGIAEAGLRLRAMEEPRPTEAMVAAMPWLQLQRKFAPMLMYVSAEKP